MLDVGIVFCAAMMIFGGVVLGGLLAPMDSTRASICANGCFTSAVCLMFIYLGVKVDAVRRTMQK